MKRKLFILLVTAIAAVMTFAACDTGYIKKDYFDELTAMAKKEYSALTLTITSEFDEGTLTGEYNVTKQSDEQFLVTYSYEQFTTIEVVDGKMIFPEEEKEVVSGEFTVNNGVIEEGDGSETEVDFSEINAENLQFDKSNFTNLKNVEGGFTADVIDTVKFCRIEAEDMHVKFASGKSALTRLVVTFTLGDAKMTFDYKFTK